MNLEMGAVARLCGSGTDVSMPKATDERLEGNENVDAESGLWKVSREASSSESASNSTS